MCLIMTALAGLATTLIWYLNPQKRRSAALGLLPLMYWGAALMWTVDGIFAVAAGEGFFNLTLDDALLGAVVVLCGVLAWLAVRGAKRLKMKQSR